MDFATLPSLSSFLSIAAPSLICAAFIWVIWRTESLHVLVHRLWQLVHGKQEITDPEIRAFIDEQSSLISFRLFAGVKVNSLDQARQLIQWAKHNGVQMRALSLCGELFDMELRQIKQHKLPSRLTQGMRLTGVAIGMLLLFVSTTALFHDQAFLTLKATQRTFAATTTQAKALRSIFPFGPAPLRIDDCSQPASLNAARTSFTENEVGILCGVLQDKDTAASVKDSLKEQRWTCALLIAFAIWLSWICFLAWATGYVAKHLAARRLDSSLPDSQLTLDFGT
jgi:hypothetical protein